MTLAVIQSRPLMRYNGKFYLRNYSDFIKYGKLCDQLIYCASVLEVKDFRIVKDSKPQTDFPYVKIVEVKRFPLREMFSPLSYNVKQLRKVINEADLVVIKTPSITIGKWAYKYAKQMHKKCILEVIACAWDSFWYHDLRGKVLALYSFWNAKNMISSANNVIYVTDQFLQRRYPTKGRSIGCSNVVLGPADETILIERQERIKTFNPNRRINIGTAGAVNVNFKGQQYVIEAVAKLVSEGYDYHYYLAGGGDNGRLKAIAEKYSLTNRVHFLGAVPRDKMTDFYRSLDIYIHPSLAEGLPRVLIEAERQALPACGANASGTPELLDEEFVFKKKSSNDICRILKKFSKDVMLEQSELNFKKSKKYSVEILDERRKTFYDMVMMTDYNKL